MRMWALNLRQSLGVGVVVPLYLGTFLSLICRETLFDGQSLSYIVIVRKEIQNLRP